MLVCGISHVVIRLLLPATKTVGQLMDFVFQGKKDGETLHCERLVSRQRLNFFKPDRGRVGKGRGLEINNSNGDITPH